MYERDVSERWLQVDVTTTRCSLMGSFSLVLTLSLSISLSPSLFLTHLFNESEGGPSGF